MALLIVIAVLVKRKPTANEPANLPALGFTLSGCLLAGLAFAGHAAAADGAEFVLQVSADAVHLLASGVWLGGLVPLAFLLRECNRNGDAVEPCRGQRSHPALFEPGLGERNRSHLHRPIQRVEFGRRFRAAVRHSLRQALAGQARTASAAARYRRGKFIAAQTDNRRIERPRRSNHRLRYEA